MGNNDKNLKVHMIRNEKDFYSFKYEVINLKSDQKHDWIANVVLLLI